MQKDLENLAKKMHSLSLEDRKYWTFQLAVCRDSAHHASSNLSYRQREERHERDKRILVFCLSEVLSHRAKNSWIKKALESFISLSEDERDSFYRTVLEKEEPKKITTKSAHILSRRKEDRTHE